MVSIGHMAIHFFVSEKLNRAKNLIPQSMLHIKHSLEDGIQIFQKFLENYNFLKLS